MFLNIQKENKMYAQVLVWQNNKDTPEYMEIANKQLFEIMSNLWDRFQFVEI